MKPILDQFEHAAADVPPVWFMRQAGRYLPEYRQRREAAGGFLALCLDPSAAAEITLQPIRRFGFDAAILFSDILIVPMALGQDLWFETGEGPRLAPAMTAGWIDALQVKRQPLDLVCQTVGLVRQAIEAEPELCRTTLIGFAGSPWTVSTYMIAGQGSKDQAAARLLSYRDPGAMAALLDRIVATTIDYLIGQARAGAEVLMLFDSWAGVLPRPMLEHMVFRPTQAIVSGVRAAVGMAIPIIGFPRGGSAWAAEYVAATGVNGLGVEETADIAQLVRDLPEEIVIQGNLDPLQLMAGGPSLDGQIRLLKQQMAGRRFIFNLGHGILPTTPLAHVEQALSVIREPNSGARA